MARRRAAAGGGESPRRDLSKTHRKTLEAVFASPTRANIAWDDLVALLRALGATEETSGGSMHGFTLNGVTAILHRPHPGHEISKPMVRQVRRFLAEAGWGA